MTIADSDADGVNQDRDAVKVSDGVFETVIDAVKVSSSVTVGDGSDTVSERLRLTVMDGLNVPVPVYDSEIESEVDTSSVKVKDADSVCERDTERVEDSL